MSRSFWLGFMVNELPFIAFFVLAASTALAIGQGDIDCVKIMQELRAIAPEALDTIIFEIEQPLNGRSIEEGRELELQAAKESIDYLRNVLNVGVKQ